MQWLIKRFYCNSTTLHLLSARDVSSLTRVRLLPPANEVWGNVICLQVCVCPQGGCLVPGGAWSWRVHGPRGCMVLGGCMVPGGGCLVKTPPTATAAGSTHPSGMHTCYESECDIASTWVHREFNLIEVFLN